MTARKISSKTVSKKAKAKPAFSRIPKAASQPVGRAQPERKLESLLSSALLAIRHSPEFPRRVELRHESFGSVRLDFGKDLLAAAEWDQLLAARTGVARVAEAKRLLARGDVYPRGCSEFVCAVLGVDYELANELMGHFPTSVGSAPPYPGLTPGDVAGWKNSAGSGHVAIYIGEDADHMFVDVREPGAKPRVKNGFYDHELFKSDAF